MDRKEYFDSIEKRLNWLVTRTKSRSSLNLNDLNIHAEVFFENLLNLIYGLSLTNLNREKINAKGIDLIDREREIIFQVTCTATTEKIRTSIGKIEEGYQGYTLKFLFIADSAHKKLMKVKDLDNPYVLFNPVNDILDVSIILREILHLADVSNIERIYTLCKNEIPLEDKVSQKSISEKDFRGEMLVKAQWNHETTNDNRYVKRENLINWLNKSVNDPSVRTISIRGMGGIGKTSLIGYWAKIDQSTVQRPLEGLFYWSFYVERDCDKFINSVLNYFENNFNFDFQEGRKNKSSIEFFLDEFYLLPPTLIILDGLEVLQEGMSESSYGSFIDSILRDFILQITSAIKPWLCITTSRFPLIDIQQKTEFKEKTISGVNDTEGSEILSVHGINGSECDRKMISNYLEGHPLGIKVFSASFTCLSDKNQPLNHFNNLFEGLNSVEISVKLEKLLWFYKNNASKLHINSLSTLSMFRTSISLNVWLDLCKELQTPAEFSDYDIKLSIGELMQIGLVIKDTINSISMYSCHPIIRDFFNHSYLSDMPESGKMVAKFLTQSPDSIEISGVASIERFIVSIEALLKTKHESEALEIYRQRLKKGEVFLNLGVPKEAKRLYRMFIDYYIIANRKQTTVGKYRQGNMDIIIHFVHPYIEYCIQLGEFQEAEKAIAISDKYRTSSVCMRWRATIKFQQGKFSEAIVFCNRAVEIDRLEIYTKDSKIESTVISLFLLFKIYIVTGQDTRSLQAKINELIKLSSIDDFSDFKIRKPLMRLLCAIDSEDEDSTRHYAIQVEKYINSIKDWYFRLQTQIDLASAYILIKEYRKALEYIESVYHKSVKESYPYILYLSSLMKVKIKILTQNDSFNTESLMIVYEQSKTNGMPYITLKAIDLLLEIYDADEDFEELRGIYKDMLGLI